MKSSKLHLVKLKFTGENTGLVVYQTGQTMSAPSNNYSYNSNDNKINVETNFLYINCTNLQKNPFSVIKIVCI